MPTASFPLSVHASGRYLIDAAGNPFRVQGDAGWEAPTELTLTEWKQYLDDRLARGFNSIIIQATSNCTFSAGAHAPRNRASDLPFTLNSSGGSWTGANQSTDADFSSTNNAYWNFIDSMMTEAQSRCVCIFFCHCYLGFGLDGTQGWAPTITNSANTATVCTNFGTFLGNRYKNFKNLVWVDGGDDIPANGSTLETRHHNMATGMQAAGATQLRIAHWRHDYLSTDNATFQDVTTVNNTYSHGPYGSPNIGPTYGRGRQAYARSPTLPAVMLESTYEGEHSLTQAQSRMIQWGAAIANVAGAFFGNSPVWSFDTGWQSALGNQGSINMTILAGIFNSLPWHRLVPDGLAGSAAIVTSGQGTAASFTNPGDPETNGMDWIVASQSPEGDCMLAYVPDDHTGSFTIDTSKLVGRIRGRWFDPSNGASQAASGSPYGYALSRSFTVPGTNAGGSGDWVLILDTDPLGKISRWMPASTSQVRR